VRRHVAAFQRRDMSRRSKARTCPRTPITLAEALIGPQFGIEQAYTLGKLQLGVVIDDA
jgi:hypothetical protein